MIPPHSHLLLFKHVWIWALSTNILMQLLCIKSLWKILFTSTPIKWPVYVCVCVRVWWQGSDPAQRQRESSDLHRVALPEQPVSTLPLPHLLVALWNTLYVLVATEGRFRQLAVSGEQQQPAHVSSKAWSVGGIKVTGSDWRSAKQQLTPTAGLVWKQGTPAHWINAAEYKTNALSLRLYQVASSLGSKRPHSLHLIQASCESQVEPISHVTSSLNLDTLGLLFPLKQILMLQHTVTGAFLQLHISSLCSSLSCFNMTMPSSDCFISSQSPIND